MESKLMMWISMAALVLALAMVSAEQEPDLPCSELDYDLDSELTERIQSAIQCNKCCMGAKYDRSTSNQKKCQCYYSGLSENLSRFSPDK